MDPLTLVGVAGGAFNIAKGIGSLFKGNKDKKDAYREQRQENERNRQFQERMLDKSYVHNLEQWNRENEYNSPSAQRQRLRDAGVNADLFYGGGPGNMMAATSPQMGAASGSGGVSPAPVSGFPDINPLEGALVGAQIENIKSQTRKNNSESQLNEIDAATRDLINQGLVTLQGVEIRAGEAGISLTKTQEESVKAQIQETYESVNYLKSATDELQERIKNYSQNRQVQLVELWLRSQETRALCSHLAALANLEYTQARDILRTYVYRVSGMQAEKELKDAQKFTEWSVQDVNDALSVKFSYEGGILKVDLDNKDITKSLEIGRSAMDILHDGVQTLNDMMESTRNTSGNYPRDFETPRQWKSRTSKGWKLPMKLR